MRRRLPQRPVEVIEEIIPDIDTVDEDPRVEEMDQDPSMSYGAGEEAEARAELDAAEFAEQNEEDEELPDPNEKQVEPARSTETGARKASSKQKRPGGGESAVGWVASKFRSVDGQEWLWTGDKGHDDVANAETRGLKSQSGKTLDITQQQLIALVQEGELAPVEGAEVGASPDQRRRQQQLAQRSAQKQQGLRAQRAAQPRGVPAGRGAPAGRGGKSTAGTPAAPGGGSFKTSTTGGPATSPAARAPMRMQATSMAARAAAMVAQPAVLPAAVAQPGRIPGYSYPGDANYPLFPGQPGYGAPMPAGVPFGLQNAMMQGGGGGGGGSFPDEGGGGGGGGGDWGGDDGGLEDDLPHDEKGEVTFPEDDDPGVPGAQYPEEKIQSGVGVDAGGGYNDDEDAGPVSFPDEGQQTG